MLDLEQKLFVEKHEADEFALENSVTEPKSFQGVIIRLLALQLNGVVLNCARRFLRTSILSVSLCLQV